MSFFNPGGSLGSSRRRNMRRNVNPWNMFGGGGNIGNFGGSNMGGGFGVPRGFMDLNTSPFGGSNLMNRMDIFDPFDQIDRMMNRNLGGWIGQQPTTRQRSVGQRSQQQQRPRSIIQQQQQQLPFIQQQQRQRQQPTTLRSRSRSQTGGGGGLGLTTAMPQKYRVSVDCAGFDPNQIRPSVQQMQNQKHLVLTCKDKRGGQTFRRSFTLPKNIKPDKLNTFLGANNQFVCEFPFLEIPTSLGLNLKPQIVGEGKGKMVVIEARIPEFINPLSVNVCVKGHECIIRFEEKTAAPDSISRAFYYNRVTLPINCDLTKIHCVQKKRWLTIRCPIITALKGGFRQVPIHRKLRHRLLQKLQEVKQQGTLSMKGQQQQPQQQQQKLKQPVQFKQQQQQQQLKQQKVGKIGGGWEQVPQQQQLQQQQQQKLPKSLSQQKLGQTTQQQQGKISQLGGKISQKGVNIPQKQQLQGKMTGQKGGQTSTSTTQRRIGSDLLHEVFGTSTQKQQQQPQWQSTTSGTQQQQKSSNIKDQPVDIQKQQPGMKKKKNKSKTGGVNATATTGIQSSSNINVDEKMKSGTNVGDKSSCVTCGTTGGNGNGNQGNKSNLRSSPTSSNANLQQQSGQQSQSGLNQ